MVKLLVGFTIMCVVLIFFLSAYTISTCKFAPIFIDKKMVFVEKEIIIRKHFSTKKFQIFDFGKI